MRLIDADEYEKRIKPYDTEDDMDKALYNFAHYHLVTTPSVQLERKTGKWTIKNGELAFWDVCSECGRMVFHKTPFYNFCPNCGAKMNGGDSDV